MKPCHDSWNTDHPANSIEDRDAIWGGTLNQPVSLPPANQSAVSRSFIG